MRNPLRSSVPALVLAGLVLVAPACSGDDGGGDTAGSTKASTESSTTDGPGGDLALKAGDTTVEVIGEPVELPKKVRRAVMDQTRRYVELATIDPLLGNEHTDDDFESLFFFTLAPNVAPSGPDRAALTDEAVPPAVDDLETSAKPVKISALSNGFGGWVMVATTIDYTVSAEVEGGPVTIKRSGDLYFAENPDDGEWLVSAYDIGVARDTGNAKSKDSATAGTTSPSSATASTDAQEESS